MSKWYQIPKETKVNVYTQISEQNGMAPYAVEKDWWVVQTLAIIFEMEIGKHLVFKGGTSLSKAWNLIERFSEDIDLAIDRRFLGFSGDLSKSKRTRLRQKTNEYITKTFYPALQEKFKEKGFTDVRFNIEDATSRDQDPRIIEIYYPNVIPSPGYIQPRVLVEIGCRSLREPFSNQEFSTLVDEYYPESDFKEDPISVPTVDPKRTFLEKIFLLHEEFQRAPEKMRTERLSRHLYDVYQLIKAGIADKAIEDQELYETIVTHRYKFTKVGDVDYNLHNPETINPIPIDNVIDEWKKDYKTMQEQMIYGEAPEFDDLIQEIKLFTKKINKLDWKMKTKFSNVNNKKSK